MLQGVKKGKNHKFILNPDSGIEIYYNWILFQIRVLTPILKSKDKSISVLVSIYFGIH